MLRAPVCTCAACQAASAPKYLVLTNSMEDDARNLSPPSAIKLRVTATSVSAITTSITAIFAVSQPTETIIAPAPRNQPPPLPPHLRALADRRSQEVLIQFLETLSPADVALLESRYKKTPYYVEGNRPYVPLWRCLAAAFLEPLLLLLRMEVNRSTPPAQAQALCDCYWQSSIELPLMPRSALEAMAAEQSEVLVLKPQLASTDGAPSHSESVKLVLALLPRVAKANWMCAMH